jgi:hypothetical protein
MKTENLERASELFRTRQILRSDIVELGNIKNYGELEIQAGEWLVLIENEDAAKIIEYAIYLLTENIEKIDEEILTL